jgi:integrase
MAAPISVRCTAALSRMLNEIPRNSPLVLTTKAGQAFKKRYFASQWKAAMTKAGIEGLHFHDLRGTAITMLSEAGNTIPQLPRRSIWTYCFAHFIQMYQPSPKGLSGRPAHCPFRGLLSVHSRCGLHTRAVTNT